MSIPASGLATTDTRARILEVAWQLLNTRGPADVTMRDVARAAWEDRMTSVLELARVVAERLATAGRLTDGWTPAEAADWLWAHVHPQGWLQLVHDRGWAQQDYERRLLDVARAVLVRGGG